MRNNRFYVYILGISFSLLLMFTSCSQEDSYSSDNGGKDHLMVNILLDVPAATSKLRSMSSSNEEKIETINVLVFTKDNSSSSEIFSYLAPVRDYESIANKNLVVKLKKTLGNQKARVVIVANIDINVRDLQGKTKDEAMELLTFDSAGKWKSDSESDFRALPMWSQSDSRTIASDTEFPTFELLRAVARIDVGLNFTSFINGYESASGLKGYALKEVYLYRSLNQGYVAPSSSAYTDGSVSGATVPSSASVNDRIDYTELSDTTQLVRSIYTVEHLAGDEDTCAALVVGLEHDGRTTYYRINFTDDDNNLVALLRNHRYVMSIKSVHGLGMDDPDAALISNPSNLEWEMTDWDENIKGIYISGDYYIAIDNRTVQLDSESNDSTNILIETNVPEEDITLTWEDSSQSDYDVSFDYSNSKITLTAKNLNSQESNRPQVLHIKTGTIDIKVSVTQKKASRAYQIICSSVQVNGTYIYHVPTDETNTITLKIRGTNADIIGYEYNIYTNTAAGITFSAKGVFTSQNEDVTLKAEGTPNNMGTIMLPFITNSSTTTSCSATVNILIPQTNMLCINYTYTGYDTFGSATFNSGSNLFMSSKNNFGSNESSMVKINGLERTFISETSSSSSDSESFYDKGHIKIDKLKAALSNKPDIVLIGFNLIFDEDSADEIITYLKSGGVVILFSHPYPFSAQASGVPLFMNKVFESDDIVGTETRRYYQRFQLLDVDDDITNGAFGDFRTLYWGCDNSKSSSGSIISLSNIPQDKVDVYSKDSSGRVVMFKHKTLNLMFAGAGEFLSNNNNSIGTNSSYPFTIDASYSAIPNTAYSGGTIYNSQLFGNMMSWAIYTANTKGINTK